MKEDDWTIDASARIQRLPPYLFGQINQLKYQKRREGADIIDLGMGNPAGPPRIDQPRYTHRDVSDSQTTMADSPGRDGAMRSQRYLHSSSLVEFSSPGMSFSQRWSSSFRMGSTACLILLKSVTMPVRGSTGPAT